MTSTLISRRPHVLYVTPMFGYPPFGGPRLRTYNTLKALARCAEVSLFLTQQPDTADRAVARAHLLTFCREVIFPAAPPSAGGPRALLRGVARRIVPRRVREALRGLSGASTEVETEAETEAVRDPHQVDELRAWIEAHRPDLLWLGFGGISYDLIPLKHVTNIPLVLETECVWSRFILREAPFVDDSRRRERILAEGRAKEAEERSGAPQVDMTTAVSDVDADYFRALTPDPERVMLLANVIDVEAYVHDSSPAVRLEQPALVFAGTFSHGTANVDATRWLLDEVMPVVWSTRPDVHLYLVGRNPAPPLLARRGPRVHLTGEVPSIAPYLRAASAAVVPLRWESGTRFKILEAFACRAPVISTTLGAEGLAVEHGRHLLLADEAEDFARAILSVVGDRGIGDSLVGPAFELVRQDYDVSSAARQIKVILARLGVSAEVRAS